MTWWVNCVALKGELPTEKLMISGVFEVAVTINYSGNHVLVIEPLPANVRWVFLDEPI